MEKDIINPVRKGYRENRKFDRWRRNTAKFRYMRKLSELENQAYYLVNYSTS